MRSWFVLFRKEWVEMARNYKIIWIPLTFILLGLAQPLTSYYMPEIMKNASNLPKGAVIKIPLPSSGEVLSQTLGQLNQMGILILVLAFMGIVSADRRSGMLKAILVKPIHYASYISAKWLSAILLSLTAVTLGMVAAWYYTNLLIGDFPFVKLIQGTGLYFGWILFIVTITVFLSSQLKSSGLVAAFALLLSIILSLLTSLLEKWMEWSPATLTSAASEIFINGKVEGPLYLPLTVTVLLVVTLLYLAASRSALQKTK